jgi:hypothetical protein
MKYGKNTSKKMRISASSSGAKSTKMALSHHFGARVCDGLVIARKSVVINCENDMVQQKAS